VSLKISEKTKYPQAAILLTPGATNTMSALNLIDTVTLDQFNSSFGHIVRNFKISAPGLTIVPKPRQDIEQIHNCFDIKNCGGACGLCFGPDWTLNNPTGNEIRLNLLGLNYDAQKNITTFKLGIVGADNLSFKDAFLTKSEKLPGGGLKVSVRLTYDKTENGNIVTKNMPEFQITIGAGYSISLAERKKLEQSGKIEIISW
jgi:hypothetical protein